MCVGEHKVHDCCAGDIVETIAADQGCILLRGPENAGAVVDLDPLNLVETTTILGKDGTKVFPNIGETFL